MKDGVRRNWWRQGMMGSVLAHTLGIKAFSETDFTADLKAITVPTLVMHGEDDQWCRSQRQASYPPAL